MSHGSDAPAFPQGSTTDSTSQTCAFETWDGLTLFHRTWSSLKPTRQAIILFHGGHEHSGRFHELVERLGRENTTYFAWDARGHGRSPGPRGYARSLHDVTQDVDVFLQHLSRSHNLSLPDTVFLGHSVGSLTVIAYVRDYQPQIRGMILGSPALHVRTYVPFDELLLRLLIRFKPEGKINSYVVSSMLTHDPEEIISRNHDPLIARPIGAKMLLSVLEEGQRLMREASEIRVPTLILSAGRGWVVYLPAEKRFFNRLGASKKELVVYPGFFHEVFHEKDRKSPIAKALAFLESLFLTPE